MKIKLRETAFSCYSNIIKIISENITIWYEDFKLKLISTWWMSLLLSCVDQDCFTIRGVICGQWGIKCGFRCQSVMKLNLCHSIFAFFSMG